MLIHSDRWNDTTKEKILPPFDNRTSQKNLRRKRATNPDRLFFDSLFLARSRRWARSFAFSLASSQLPAQTGVDVSRKTHLSVLSSPCDQIRRRSMKLMLKFRCKVPTENFAENKHKAAVYLPRKNPSAWVDLTK